jgi:hypothetical protein
MPIGKRNCEENPSPSVKKWHNAHEGAGWIGKVLEPAEQENRVDALAAKERRHVSLRDAGGKGSLAPRSERFDRRAIGVD